MKGISVTNVQRAMSNLRLMQRPIVQPGERDEASTESGAVMADTFNKDFADRSKLILFSCALCSLLGHSYILFKFSPSNSLLFVPVFLNIGADVRECRRALVPARGLVALLLVCVLQRLK
jgi:hypothetical protein